MVARVDHGQIFEAQLRVAGVAGPQLLAVGQHHLGQDLLGAVVHAHAAHAGEGLGGVVQQGMSETSAM